MPDELARIDAAIAVLREELHRTRQAHAAAEAALRNAMAERAWLVEQLRAAPAAPTPPPVPTPAVVGPETSTRTVQNVLFVLGGILLGTAAVVFTAVAWATYGVVGRAVILAIVTLLALATPPLALVRRLRATAETFATIGLFLLALDGYALWYAGLAGVRSMEGERYAALVAAVTAVVALGYGRLTRLAGPAFVALVAAQPVVVLLMPDGTVDAVAALLFAAVAAGNGLVAGVAARRQTGVGSALAKVAWSGCLIWGLLAGGRAVLAESAAVTVPGRALAGAAVVAIALVLVVGAWGSRDRTLWTVAAGGVVLAVDVAVLLTALTAWPTHPAAILAGTALATAAAVRAVAPLMPEWVRPGPRRAAGIVATAGVAHATVLTAWATALAIAGAFPFWAAPVSAPRAPALTWALPVALLALTAAVRLVAPRWTDAPATVGGTVLVVLSLPAALRLAWWAPPAVALGGTVALAMGYLVVRGRSAAVATLRTATLVGAAVLVIDALLTSVARPELTALTLIGVVVLGLAVAAADRSEVGAVALAAGLLALPPAVGSALRSLEIPAWWSIRGTVGAAALLLLAAAPARRRSTEDRPLSLARGAAVAAVASAVIWPLVAMAVGDEPMGVYSGLSLLLIAASTAVVPSAGALRTTAVASVPAALLFVIAELPAVLAVTVRPYEWLGAVWSGRPTGVGLLPHGEPVGIAATDAVALGLLALTGAVAVFARTRRLRTALSGLGFGGPTAILAALVVVRAPWPSLPLATMVLGLVLVVPVAVAGTASWRVIVLSGQGFVSIGAGLAGALSVEWATLTALAIVVVAFSVVGATGRTVEWRVLGCVIAVAASTSEAWAAARASQLATRTGALVILGVGILALFAGALLRRENTRRAEATATEAAATGAAAVALAMVAGEPGWAATVCAVWGLAFGGRALVPGITASVRRACAAVGGGLEVVAWWLLLADRDVRWVEAYTLPLAGVALFAGWAALRSRPELRSWVAYGPALLAGFLPTLAMVIGSVGEVWRRLALFIAALVVVVLGSVHHRRAPVVVGGAVLIAVAAHELALVWQLLPGWIPLGAGGAILLFLAITYERRRRDLSRLRTAINRMT